MSNTSNTVNTGNSQQQILSQFESMMEAIVNGTDSALRISAEEKLSEAKNSNLLLYLECLLKLTLNSSSKDIKQLCIIMFRQACQPNNTLPNDWNKIPISAYNVFENGLLTAITKENDKKTYLLICDAMGTLAARIIPCGYWKNLLTQLLELVNKPNTYHKQGFLRVLENLAEYCIEFLKPNFENIYKVINIAIRDENNVDVVLQAYKSLISILVSIDNMNELNLWKDLIPICINLLNKTTNEQILRELLSSTIDLVSHRFILVKPILDQLLICDVKIARNDNFEFDTRKLAFEMLVFMATNNALLLRQHSGYMNSVVELSMYYLSLYNDSIDFNIAEDDIEQEYIWNGRQWTSDLAKELGGKPYLNIAQSMLKSGLESSNWKQCYSSLQTFIQIIRHIKDIDGWDIPIKNDNNKSKDIIWDQLLPKIIHLIINKSTRSEIKHSALYLIRTLIIQYENRFVDRYYLIFYNTIITLLTNYKNIHFRVLQQCIKCLSFFNKYATINQFKDKSDIILKQLLLIVTDNNKGNNNKGLINDKLKGHSITAIGTCSDVMCGQYFLPYYDKFMPICMNIINNNKLSPLLRGKAMECIGMIGESVGNMKFNKDAHKLMNVLLPFHKQLIDTKNTNKEKDKLQIVYNYMNQLFARISRCIGTQFIQYFKFIIPSILDSASIEAAQILLPDEPKSKNINGSVFTVHLRGIGDTKFCIDPISLDEKDTACHMLYQFCKDQCIGFFPYVIETANIMKSLMRYQYNTRVRAAATLIIPLLLKSIILNINVINNNNENNKYVEIFDALFAPFIVALFKEPDVIEQIPILEVLGQISSIIGNNKNKIFEFSDSHLLSIAEILENILTESQERIKERIDDELGEKLIVDEEKKNQIEWANDFEIELIAHVIDVIEFTFKSVKDRFTPFFIYGKNYNNNNEEKNNNSLGEATKLMLTKNEKYILSGDSEILQSICIFIDCIQYGGILAADKYINWFYSLICKYIDDINGNCDLDIKQTCIYGIGVFAKCGYLNKLDINYKYFNKFLKDIQ
eukprot:388803_1